MMAYRRDAVVRAAELICAGDALARSLGEELVCTFSNIEIHPQHHCRHQRPGKAAAGVPQSE